MQKILTNFYFFVFTTLFVLFIKCEANTSNHSIVFTYIGPKLPSYLPITINQAKLFNDKATYYLIINKSTLKSHAPLLDSIKKRDVQLIFCEDLKESESHKKFNKVFKALGLDGYHKYTTERFFYIDELMKERNLSDVFQVEADVMLYFNIEEYLNLFHKHYPGIAAPFQNDLTASVSFTYFSTPQDISHLCQFISNTINENRIERDMSLFASYKNAHSDFEIDHLPTIPYDDDLGKSNLSKSGDFSSRSWKYSNHIGKWQSIFDPDSLGYLLTNNIFYSNRAIFTTEEFKITWEKDIKSRRIPYITTKNCWYLKKPYKYRINTLHIYSKCFKGVQSKERISPLCYSGYY